jgi:hypothetical protein
MDGETTTAEHRRRPVRRTTPARVAVTVGVAALAWSVTACGTDAPGADTSASSASSRDDGGSRKKPSPPPGASGKGEDGAPAAGGGGALDGTGGGSDGGVRCAAQDLKPAVAKGDAAAGNIYYDLKLTNAGDEACELRGFPGVSLLQRDGGEIGEPADREGDQGSSVELEPGQAAHATLHTVNKGVDEAGCWKRPDLLKVYPPDSLDAVTLRTDAVRVCGDVFTVSALSASP